MIRLTFEIGDTAYLHNGGTGDNPLIASEVVHKFELWGQTHYVVAIDTHIDPVLEVRCGWSLSDTSEGPIGMYRDTKEQKAARQAMFEGFPIKITVELPSKSKKRSPEDRVEAQVARIKSGANIVRSEK